MSSHSAADGVIKWLEDGGWIWVMIFWGAITSMFEGARDFLVETFQMLTGARHRQRMRELELRAEIAKSQAHPETPAPLPQPGPCVHRNVVPVVHDEHIVAWLCRTCDEQLPANWAVRKEDL